MITPDLIAAILRQYILGLHSLHGISHWARVLENGLKLAGTTGASAQVVQLFAVFHDARRLNEYRDLGHGKRGGVQQKQMIADGYSHHP